ncbi:MAG: nitroreductase [Bacteroidetes bacterium]|nr:MAG: nitroreductase [Bacteroidota bacterium]
MEFYQLIEGRETIRVYDTDRKIPDEVLNNILNAGRLAPSASNRQPWTFVLVASKEKLSAVKATYQREWFQKAPYIVVVVGDKTKSWVRPKDGYNSIETDLAIAMDHIILAAENEGVGACWVIAFDYEMLADAIGLKKNEVIYSMAAMGYPPEGFQKKGNKKRRLLEEVVRKI